MVVWGTNFPFVKYVLQNIGPGAFLFVRFLVMPALMLNYLGQGALVLEDPLAIRNPFYVGVPEWARMPMVVLATAAYSDGLWPGLRRSIVPMASRLAPPSRAARAAEWRNRCAPCS